MVGTLGNRFITEVRPKQQEIQSIIQSPDTETGFIEDLGTKQRENQHCHLLDTEAGDPGENPHLHEENMKTPHVKNPAGI